VSCPLKAWEVNSFGDRVEQPDQPIDAEALKAETQEAMDTLQELQAQFEVVSAMYR
jgi:hypothetical protein